MKNIFEKRLSLYEMLTAFSFCMDLIDEKIVGHHNKVAYISMEIGKNLGLSELKLKKLVASALIHDLGIFYVQKFSNTSLDVIVSDEKFNNSLYDLNFFNTFFNLDFEDSRIKNHAEIGYQLFKDKSPVSQIPEIIRYHHHSWNKKNDSETLMLSNILHLADRVAVLIEEDTPILTQRKRIIKIIKQNQDPYFFSEAVEKVINLVSQDFFLFNVNNLAYVKKILNDFFQTPIKLINDKEILKFSKLISHLVDYRSSFTATHSAGVASIAKHLSEYMNYSKKKQKKLEIAGHLHDMGKLVVPPNILNKTGKLTNDEWSIMKSHVYYTYHALSTSEKLKEIREWAAFHHEKLNGTGYPFHLTKDQLSFGSKIIGVADVFTAITEDRPYRKKFKYLKAIEILSKMAKNGELDSKLVNIIVDNFNEFNELREEIQVRNKNYFKEFNNKAKDIINSDSLNYY